MMIDESPLAHTPPMESDGRPGADPTHDSGECPRARLTGRHPARIIVDDPEDLGDVSGRDALLRAFVGAAPTGRMLSDPVYSMGAAAAAHMRPALAIPEAMVAPVAAPPSYAGVETTFRLDPGASEALGEAVYVRVPVASPPGDPAYGIAEDGEVEVRLAARLDLMRAIDEATAMISAATEDVPFGSVLADAAKLDDTARLLDRLGAYLKGQDDRIIEIGAALGIARSQSDGLLAKVDELRKLIGEACAAVRLVSNLASMSDVEAQFTTGEDVRSGARAALHNYAFTLPRLYSEEDRQRARDAVFAAFYDPNRSSPKQLVSTTTGDLVDLVASALGMRKAGA